MISFQELDQFGAKISLGKFSMYAACLVAIMVRAIDELIYFTYKIKYSVYGK